MAFGRKKKEDPFLEKEKEMLSENENYSTTEIDMRSTYIIKILVPIDKYGNDYKAFFITENENLTANIDKAKEYIDWDEAVEDSKYVTEKYKKDKIWAPTFVCKKSL